MDIRFPIFKYLPAELIVNIAERLLDDDVVDYMNCRAVCSECWKSIRPPSGFASHFRPRHWIMLSDGDANVYAPDRRCFLNLKTGKSLILRLPELDAHSVIAESDGLLVLMKNNSLKGSENPYVVRLFNPFTHDLIDLPTGLKKLKLVRRILGKIQITPQWACSYGCSISASNLPLVVLFSAELDTLFSAIPRDVCWQSTRIRNRTGTIFYKGQFLIADAEMGIQILRFSDKVIEPVISPIPSFTGRSDQYYLAEFNESMYLLVYKKDVNSRMPLEVQGRGCHFFKVNLDSRKLILLPNFTDIAIFLGYRGRVLILSTESFSSIKDNSIYYCTGTPTNPIVRLQYNTDDRKPEAHQQQEAITTGTIHDNYDQIVPLTRPFTIVQHLATYCTPLQWSNGLMYHEFVVLPEGWYSADEFWENVKKKFRIFRAKFNKL